MGNSTSNRARPALGGGVSSPITRRADVVRRLDGDSDVKPLQGQLCAAVYSYRLHTFDLATLAQTPKWDVVPNSVCLQCNSVKKLSSRSVATLSKFEWSETEDSDYEPDPLYLRIFDCELNRQTSVLEFEDQYPYPSYEPIFREHESYAASPLIAVHSDRKLRLWNADTTEKVLPKFENSPRVCQCLRFVEPWDQSLFMAFSGSTRQGENSPTGLRCYDLTTGRIRGDVTSKKRAPYVKEFCVDVSNGCLYAISGHVLSAYDPRGNRGEQLVGKTNLKQEASKVHCSSDRWRVEISTSERGSTRTRGQVHVETWDPRKMSRLSRFMLPDPTPPYFSHTHIVRVGIDEFVSVSSQNDSSCLFVWNAEDGVCTQSKVHHLGFCYDFGDLCTIGSPYDVDRELLSTTEEVTGPEFMEVLQFMLHLGLCDRFLQIGQLRFGVFGALF